MQRRQVRVLVEPTARPSPHVDGADFCGNSRGETHTFDATVFTHHGERAAGPADVWYLVADVRTYFESVFGYAPDFLNDSSQTKVWQDLVRQYNTTLQGLSYHVRDMNVIGSSRFVNGDTLARNTNRKFVVG